MRRFILISLAVTLVFMVTGCMHFKVLTTGYCDPNSSVQLSPESQMFVIENQQAKNPFIEKEIKTKIVTLLKKKGYKDHTAKAIKSFYWEGQEGRYGKLRATTFGSRNYPDFIITAPYLLAVEYKQSATGSAIKQGIGQSIMHTLCGDFDFVYYLFHDQSKNKRIQNSIKDPTEATIIEKMWQDFNVYIRFV